jgi:antitoxin component YwqK of YwqJK toxin-antitoxin module
MALPCATCRAEGNIETQYYVNGQVRLETEYNKRHEKHGIERLYYETGEVWSKTVYLRDRKDGLEQIFYKNGQVMREKQFKKGVQDGMERAFWESGELMEEMPHVDGVKSGTAKIYDTGGGLIEEQDWENDSLVDTRKIKKDI